MLREIAVFILLLSVSGAFWFANAIYQNEILARFFTTFLAVAFIYFFFRIVIDQVARRVIREKKTLYMFNKALFILSIISVLVVGILIWVKDPSTLLVSYGIIAAGLAIALQDVFRNFVGGIIIAGTGTYKVGDRVQLGDVLGDIMDIGLMNTTLMELKAWVSGDQPTGRISIIPNAIVISGTVHNYTKDHNFIWDELSIPLTYDSDWKEAISLFLSIVQRETEQMTLQAEQEIERIGEKYYLPRKVTEPAIYVTLTDNWIRFDIRYVTDVRNRRNFHDRLNRLLLEEVEKSSAIKIASETIEVSGTQSVRLIHQE